MTGVQTCALPIFQGNILLGNASGIATGLDASGDTKVLIGNGTSVTSVVLSGDVLMTNAGVTSI